MQQVKEMSIKKLMILMFTTLALICAAVGQQTPVTFRGAYIGQPLSDYVSCTDKPKALQKEFKIHGKACEGKRGKVGHVHTGWEQRKDGVEFTFDNQRLVEISIFVPGDGDKDWAKVSYDITQKLGVEPASSVPQVFQNGFGARHEFEQGFWSAPTLVVYARIHVPMDATGVHTKPKLWNDPNSVQTDGIWITIMSPERAKMPWTTNSSLD